MTDLTTIAIIGCGHGHGNLFVPALAARDDVHLAGLSDPNPAAVERHRQLVPDARPFSDYRVMLDEVGPGLVFVLGRHDAMAEAAIEVASRGIPMVLEKPGAIDLAELESVRSAVARSGSAVTVPFVQRYGPLPGLINRVGELRHLEFAFLAGEPARFRENGNPWLVEHKASGGGVLTYLGVHFIDLVWSAAARRGLRPPRLEASVLRRFAQDIDVEDFASVHLKSGGGMTAAIEVSYTYPRPWSRHVAFVFAGAEGFVTVSGSGHVVISTRDGAEEFDVDVDSNNYYGTFVDAAVDGLRDGFRGMPTLDDLAATMGIIDEAYRTDVVTEPV